MVARTRLWHRQTLPYLLIASTAVLASAAWIVRCIERAGDAFEVLHLVAVMIVAAHWWWGGVFLLSFMGRRPDRRFFALFTSATVLSALCVLVSQTYFVWAGLSAASFVLAGQILKRASAASGQAFAGYARRKRLLDVLVAASFILWAGIDVLNRTLIRDARVRGIHLTVSFVVVVSVNIWMFASGFYSLRAAVCPDAQAGPGGATADPPRVPRR
jgi:hypothetical protein